MQDIENPMVIDSLWNDCDDVDRETREREEEERWYKMGDMAYDDMN